MKVSDEFIQKLNDRLDKKVLVYSGPVANFDEIEIELKFKLRIVGSKQMISIGEWTDYIVFDVEVISYSGTLSPIFNIIYDKSRLLNRGLTDKVDLFFDMLNLSHRAILNKINIINDEK